MKKYYIGLAVLFALALGALVYTLQQGVSYKNDKKTTDKFTQIADKFSQYTNSNPIPDSLDQAGIKDVPGTITYTKIDSTQFKICATYDHAASSFDAGWSSLIGGYSGAAPTDTSSSDKADNSFIDTTVVYSHKKGENCQTVKPYSASALGLGSSSSYGSFSGDTEVSPKAVGSSDSSQCSSAYDDLYTRQGSVTISKIDTSASTIYFSTTGQTWKDDKGAAVSMQAVASKKYDTITTFCDAGGKAIEASGLKAGTKVKIYMGNESSDYVDKVQL
jgi:hypothetical protein